MGTAFAVITTFPRIDGRQLQVAIKFEPLTEVNLFLQPGITTFLALKVILEATLTSAVMVTGIRKVAALLNSRELKDEVSTTSVTVIVIDCVPAFPDESVAVSVIS